MTDLDLASRGGPLPLLSLLPACREVLRNNLPLLLTAEPGAGKTSLLPLALLDEPWLKGQKVLVLEPRRLAAYAAAQRASVLTGTEVGQLAGFRTGEETRTSPTTRLEFITEGVLLRLLSHDPGLEGIGAVIFDEFHERTLEGDQGLAFCLDVRQNLRDDLRLAVMSATLDTEAMRAVMPDAVEEFSPGRTFPVTTTYRPLRQFGSEDLAQAVQDAWRGTAGSLLVFLPGWGEIQQLKDRLEGPAKEQNELLSVLHATLAPADQTALLSPGAKRRTILSSAVAETSLTLPDVDLVIDAGWSRLVRLDPRTGMDKLFTERVSQASADQRRGRAGRVRPGQCWRLWAADEVLEPFTPPQILRSELSGLVLSSLLWGAPRPKDLRWVTPPSEAAWDQSLRLLETLGAVQAGRPTNLGRTIEEWGVSPRLGRLLAEGQTLGALPTAAACVAALEERNPRPETDFRQRLSFSGSAYRRWQTLCHRVGIKPEPPKAALVGPLLAGAFPERVCQRQTGPDSGPQGPVSQYQSAGGRSLTVTGNLARERWLAVAEADAGTSVGRIWTAAPLTGEQVERLASDQGSVWEVETPLTPKLYRVRRWGALLLERTGVPLAQAPEIVAAAWVEAVAAQGLDCLPWSDEAQTLLGRLRAWAAGGKGPNPAAWTEQALVAELETWAVPFLNFAGGAVMTAERLQQALVYRLGPDAGRLEAQAPRWVTLPSGKRRRVEYGPHGPYLELKLQEAFGWAQAPQVLGKPLVLHLLSPAGRPLQITADLAGFWKTSYREVRKDYRGRYPKHAWPEDPTDPSELDNALKRHPVRATNRGGSTSG